MKYQPHLSFSRLPNILLVVFGVLWMFSVAISAADKPSTAGLNPSVAPAARLAKSGPVSPVQDKDFVGNDTCLTCHEEQGKSLAKTLHGRSQDVRTPAARADRMCETCHGPGKAHVESGDKKDIKSFKTISTVAANETCMSCHSKNASHAQWSGSMHDSRKVSCVNCHSVHSSKSDTAQLKTVRASETCMTCHTRQALKMKKSSHMPLHEGKMECTSCHSPHGSNNVRMLKVGNSVNESCVSCHTEKRGPFLWEHAPVANSCVTCHDPHGSNNDRLLVAKVPMLCQRCHVPSRHPATVYDGTQVVAMSNRLIGRSCINCHQLIHGSNSPAGYYWHR